MGDESQGESEMQIEGVIVKKLKVIADERGHLMEMIRNDDECFAARPEFGQMYLTTAYPGVVKAWHYHWHQDDNFCVVKGMAKVALYDGRPKSPTYREVNEFFIGEKNPCVIHIPAFVWHGYKCIGNEPCHLINMVTRAYDYKTPDEHRHPYNADDGMTNYNWNKDING
jgi:dTDP-4-dehydrorhamnose 3,5-epimerase